MNTLKKVYQNFLISYLNGTSQTSQKNETKKASFFMRKNAFSRVLNENQKRVSNI